MKFFSFVQFKRIPFFVWLLLANAFLLISAPAIAPPDQIGRFQTALIVYMLLTTAFMTLVPRQPWMRVNLNQAVVWFVGGFIATVILLTSIREIPHFFTSMQLTGPVFLTAFHAIVVATNETWIFQGFLPILVGPLISCAAFSIFHYAAYGGAWPALLTAFIAGLLFYFIAKYVNIWLAVSIHAGYNVVLLGIFALGGI